MSTPHDDDQRHPYAPPYGSAPAYSAGGSGGAYVGDAAPASPQSAAPQYTPPAYGEQSGGSTRTETTTYDTPANATPQYETPQYDQPSATATYGPPIAPSTPAPGRSKRTRTAAVLLAACLLSGGIGGVVGAAVDDDSPTTVSSASGSGVTRTTSAPVEAAPGTTAAAAATIGPSVVTIAFTGQQSGTNSFGRAATQSVSGTGSGIVIESDGYIVTNNHVVAAAVDGGTVSVTFSDGSTVPAKIVGTDPTTDLAVIKVDKTGLTAAQFADSSKLVVGQTVIAVGAPLGLSNTVTQGIVSTLNRPVRTGEADASDQAVIDAVQTDAAINPGNSGGALVDLTGKVVGVNSAIATAGGTASGEQAGNIGVGFAIPANDVAEVADELIKNGKAVHPIIGISVGDAPGAATGTPGGGAQVQAVTGGGPAANAGLQEGDVITKIDDRAVTDADSLIVSVRSHDPGDNVTVTYSRGGSTQTATVSLAEAPTTS